MVARQARRQFLRYRATGNPEALGRVFDLTASRLLLVALHLVRDAQQAEDLVQTTFLEAIQTAKTYDAKRPLLPWLVGILTHRAMDLQRRQVLRRGAQEDGEPSAEVEDQHPGPVRIAQDHEVLQHVAQALDKVPGRYRQVLVLHLVHDLRPIQIAHALERSPEAVRTQLHRGRDMLRRALPTGLALPTAMVGLPGAGLAAARTKVMTAAKAAMPASVVASTAVLANTVGKSTLLTVTAVSLGLVASLLLLNRFDSGSSEESGDTQDGTAAVEVRENQLAEIATFPSVRTNIVATENTKEDQLAVTVVDDVGRPLEATVWRWEEGVSKISRETTDAAGVAIFRAAEQQGALIATAPGRQLRVQQLARLRGNCRLELPRARRVQGWLAVDDKIPVEPIRLRLHGRGEDLLGFLQEDLRKQMLGDRPHPAEVTTAADGSFQFEGLPDDWAGTLELPQHLWFRAPSLEQASNWRYYVLKAPEAGLQLAATQLPTVRGQVVWADSGKPIPDVDILATVYLADGNQTPWMGLSADAEGCFCFGAYPGQTARMRDWANHPERRSAMVKISLRIRHDEAIKQRLVFDPREKGGSGDVGSIRLQRAAGLWCLVVDTEGRPIQGALVEGRSVSKPTDRDGLTRVSVARLDRRRFVAGALGYCVDEAEARNGSGTRPDPLRLELVPGNYLRIQVRDPKGGVPSGFQVSVHTPGRLFTGPEHGHLTMVHRRLGGRLLSYRNPTKRTDLWCRYALADPPKGNGEIIVPSLVDTAPLEIRVMDRLQQRVAVRRVDPLGPSSPKTVTIHLARQPVSVTGRVLDVHGNPLSGARVSAGIAQALADREGRFCLACLYPAASICVVASCHGYVTAALENVALAADAEPLEFRLVAGREVLVEFTDPKGNRVGTTVCSVDVKDPGIQRLKPGLFRFKNLPARVVTFTTRIANREHRLKHDTTIGRARFLLPPMGTCVVTAAASLRPKEMKFFRARVLYQPSGDVAAEGRLGGAEAGPLLRTETLLLPVGRYTVEVGHYVWTGDERQRDFHTVARPRPVTVESGKVSRCRF